MSRNKELRLPYKTFLSSCLFVFISYVAQHHIPFYKSIISIQFQCIINFKLTTLPVFIHISATFAWPLSIDSIEHFHWLVLVHNLIAV